MKKILFEQVDPDHVKTAESFRCSEDKNHIVEDPIMCPSCQHLFCVSCVMKSSCSCKICGSKINTQNPSLPPCLKNLLNPIYLKCENFKSGCAVEIDYENYRSHTKNCKYKPMMIPAQPLTDVEKQKFNNIVPAFLENILNDQMNYNERIFNEMKTCTKRSEFERFSVEELKDFLAFKGVPKTGSKDDLIFKVQACLKYSTEYEQTRKWSNLEAFLKQLKKIREELEDKTLEELKGILSSKGLPQTGNKLKLVEDLIFKGGIVENIPETQPKKLLVANEIPNYLPQKIWGEEPQKKKIDYPPIIDYLKKHTQEKTSISDQTLMNFSNFDDFTVEELKDLLEARQIPKSGNKDDLMLKLKLYLNEKIIKKQKIYLNDSESDDFSDDSEEEDEDESEEESGFSMSYPVPGNYVSSQSSDKMLSKLKRIDLERFTNDELREILERRCISKTGNKDDLIDKLMMYFQPMRIKQKKPKPEKNKNLGKQSKKIKKNLFEKTIDELKDMLYRKHLPVSGNKPDLIERLMQAKREKKKVKKNNAFSHIYM